MKRRLGYILLGLLIALAAGAGWLYFTFGRQVNFAGFRGTGSVTAVNVPEGFQVNVFASGLNGPRFMAVGPDGVLHVADRGNNRIVTLPDADADGVADEIRVFAENLNRPHSLIFHAGSWYVGVPSGVIRLTDVDGNGTADARAAVVDDYPTDGTHTTRTVEFLPDGRMVVSIGSSCNVCEEEDPRRAGIVVYAGADGSGEEIFATGLRNAVGLAVHPQTGALWVTNNGRDLMGDELPPDTIRIVAQGTHHGWPTCHSSRIVDPDMGTKGDCEGVVEPVAELQAHSAPLGLAFYTGDMFPETYRGDLFVAYHGSWNRSVPTGYKVVRLPLENGRPQNPVDFATGWLRFDAADNSAQVSGRPVDVTVGTDGALYVSDDKGGFIYRISYIGP